MPLHLKTFVTGVIAGWATVLRGTTDTPLPVAPTIIIRRGPSPLACFVVAVLLILSTAAMTTLAVNLSARAAAVSFAKRSLAAAAAAYSSMRDSCIVQLDIAGEHVKELGQFVQVGAFHVWDSFPSPSITGDIKAKPGFKTQQANTSVEEAIEMHTGADGEGWVLVRPEDAI